MKTISEIKEQINRTVKNDLFGTFIDLLEFLLFEDAKEYLKPEVTKAEWATKTIDEKTVIAEMKEYMVFALDKASNHRGISASRSIDHFKNWLFLLGDNETLTFAEDDSNYSEYGAPILKAICDKYNFGFPQDSGMQNMAKGLPCYEGCEEGC